MSLLLLAAGVSASTVTPCALPFAIVRDEAAARAIAQVVIASAPKKAPGKGIKRYDLRVHFVQERESWMVYEDPVSAVEGIRILGGGGLAMEIAACDGAVSDINRQI